MSVNLYDHANELERAIRQSEEFTQLQAMYDAVNSDESAKGIFENFRDIQLGLQQKQMNGEEISEDEIAQAQKTAQLVQQHEIISKLMESEQRMSMLIQELNKVIMKPLEELYGAMDNQGPTQ
ncbi:YlbF family regulator [Jeotgalibacillus sp. S-D1]|uniref:YlbF family regulator n=1 Tax=Jeotgalibacillus sp. S-D1 TaxID=2552189 RepID=UPI00105AACFF|nr:YlbF family regulator [Jeotgalibacillus sp. S-D1]TDL35404.1 YlbF family regulator [Jeotgalibacillus sp. S-D1]